jgi:hypothetical protein
VDAALGNAAMYLTQATGIPLSHCRGLLETRDDLALSTYIRNMGELSQGRRKRLFAMVKGIKRNIGGRHGR